MNNELRPPMSTPPSPPPPPTGPPLDELVAFILRFVVLPIGAARLLALWIAHTYVAAAADHTPYLHIHSPLPRCGKSVLLRILAGLVHAPFVVSDASPAAIFRTISQTIRTLIFDEYDAAISTNGGDRASDYTALANAGYENGPAATIVRCEGPLHQPTEFNVYGPKAFAGIGKYTLKEATRDRSISIGLQRKGPGDQVERFRDRKVAEEMEHLRSSLEAWAETAIELLPLLDPAMPPQLNDRQQDITLQLISIATLTGGAWPEYARQAAVECMAEHPEDNLLLSELLLHDIRRVFDDSFSVDQIRSKDLVYGLRELEESPWASLGARGGRSGIDERWLASRLAQFEIRPIRFRPNGGRDSKLARGYARTAFEDAWVRYAAPEASAE